MTDITLLIVAIIAYLIVFIIFWVEYKFSDCKYGGSYSGRDNWLITFIKDAIKKNRDHKKDICDI